MKASLKNAPVSAQKARIVADLIRSKRLDIAVSLLQFSTKKSAFLMHKLLLSALANSSASDVDSSRLVVSKIYVDKAGSLKRVFPRAKGKADRIEKQRSHMFVEFDRI